MQMALRLTITPLFSKVYAPSFSLRNTTSFGRSSPTHPTVRNVLDIDAPATTEKERRSANYTPNIWDYNSMSSAFLASHDYTETKYVEEVEMMKKYVKDIIIGDMEFDPLQKLELIDVVQRLGLGYHFDAEIKHVLQIIHDKSSTIFDYDDLYATALQFRLLRQHGYNVHQDVFRKFMNSESGSFRESLSEDVKGMLSLYEASFLGLKEESIVDEAMAFSTTYLKMTLTKKKDLLPQNLCKMVEHALDMPIHWRPNRLEALWFMDVYKDEPHMDPTLLKLAKLDYNMVQSSHQKNIVQLTRWWTELGLSKMSFFRDRLMEHYLWISFMVVKPYKAHLIATTKIACMITTIDDCYDVYGTLDELELLTEFIRRWDITEINRLPPALRSCFLALFNTTNEIGLELMLERGFNFIPYLHKMWTDLCKSYLQEARWYHGGIKPTFKDYCDNGVISSGSLPMLVTCFVTTTDNISEEVLDYVSKYPSIMRCCGEIGRLTNDLGTSSYELARGDNLKSMECYMAETGCTEGVAREHIQNLVKQIWKVMNKDVFMINYPIMKKEPLVEACLNLSRASQCFYRNGDGHGVPDNETQQRIMSIFVQPVPMDDI